MKYSVLPFCFITMLLLCSACISYSQYNKVWAFGDSAGIDFNTSPPTLITTHISTTEGCASICDAAGRLLFYTDGTTVWDAGHNVMPNGQDLIGYTTSITYSSSQAAIIVPVPGRTSLYYLFSLAHEGYGKLYYSIIDMTLNEGMGDVISDSKGKILAKELTEQMTAVSGNNCDIWLLVSGRVDLKIRAYNISFEGIDTVPVTSPRIAIVGDLWDVRGCMEVSPDRTKMACAQGNLVLYDFDATTGKATKPVVLASKRDSFSMYGVAFSPGNSKLYATASALANKGVYQFDVSLSDSQQIAASKVKVGNGQWAIKTGPDGKMYISSTISSTSKYLSVILNSI